MSDNAANASSSPSVIIDSSKLFVLEQTIIFHTYSTLVSEFRRQFSRDEFRNDKFARNFHRSAWRGRKLRIWQGIKGKSSSHATLFSGSDRV